MRIHIKTVLKRLLKYKLTGQIKKTILRNSIPCSKKSINRLGLYLHIPFCKNLCPYCPYNRIEYDEDKANQYEKAVFREIDLFKNDFKGKEIGSIYIGGGTPTTMRSGLINIIEHLKMSFDLSKSDICIELAPTEMPTQVLKDLKDAGITMISVGAETFQDSFNEILQRNMDGATVLDAVKRAMTFGFDAVNIDLMFSLPGQRLEDLRRDIKSALNCGVHQISTYPLFSFPYTELGRMKKIKEVTRPSGKIIRRMFAVIEEECLNNGYKRCAVWSFIKKEYKKFSSVSRHYYKGFGASAGSMLGDCFYVNTFDVDEYCKALEDNKKPIALSTPFNERMEMAYWLYWRIYEMNINKNEFFNLFNRKFNNCYGDIFNLLKFIGFAKEDEENINITSKGAYWVHRIQNEYSLSNIQEIWGTCIFNPWPKEVSI